MRAFLLAMSALAALGMPALIAVPAVAQTAPAVSKTSEITFITGPDAGDVRASRWIGATVKNNADETIGDVNDLVLSPAGQVKAVVVGVGGFAGVAEKNIAIEFADTQLRTQENGVNVVSIDTTKEALMAAPEFRVSGEKTMRDRLNEASKAFQSGYETVKDKAMEGYDRAKEAMRAEKAKQPPAAENPQ